MGDVISKLGEDGGWTVPTRGLGVAPPLVGQVYGKG